MADPYKVLGVARNASPEEIRKAYRKLAKESHPDLHPGDADAESRFKEISAANDIIGDPDKRKRFDAGEIDETGAEKPERRYYREYAEADPNMRYGSRASREGGDAFDAEDFFADLFRNRGARSRTGDRPADKNVRYTLAVDFLDAAKGSRNTVSMPDGKTLNIEIPPGIHDGQILRLKGQGLPGNKGEPSGDAYVEIQILPHPELRRDGYDIHSVLPVSLGEALNGASVRVETIDGPVDVRIPKMSKDGQSLRLRQKGVARDRAEKRGDHFVHLEIALPQHPDDELASFMADWEARNPQQPRQRRGDRT